jgi:hypothetical protein
LHYLISVDKEFKPLISNIRNKQGINFYKLYKFVENAVSRPLLFHPAVSWFPFEPKVQVQKKAGYSDLVEFDVRWKKQKKDPNIGICIIEPARIVQSQEKKAEHQMAKRTPAVFTQYLRLLKYKGLGSYLTGKKQIGPSSIIKSTVQPMEKNYVLLPYAKGYNYYHWWADTIADLWFLQQGGIDLSAVDGICMSYQQLSWQKETLQMCGIKESKVVPHSEVGIINAAKLICPLRPRGSKLTPGWLSRALRDITGWEHLQKSESQSGRRIYISRKDAGRRRILNEQIIIDKLHENGFEIYQLNKLGIKEQQQLFSSADIIFSSHGAGLTNIVWCQPGTVVVEFIPYYLLKPCFMRIAEQCSLGYFPITISRGLSYDKKGLNDIEVPVEYFDYALNIIEKL